MSTLINDIKYAFRQLRKSPGFTLVAVLSLALGIGANTTVFSGLNAILLRKLPVRDAQDLRLINWTGYNAKLNSYRGMGPKGLPGGRQMGASFPFPAYRDFRDHGQGFDEVFAYFAMPKGATSVVKGVASVSGTMLVSGNFFQGYGADTHMGRPLSPQDDSSEAAPVAVVTHRWWKRHFGQDPNALGQMVALNKLNVTIVGILPPDFVGPILGDPTDIYVPMSTQPQLAPNRALDSPRRWWVQIMGRLSHDVHEVQAEASLAPLFAQTLSVSNTTMDKPGIRLQDGSRGGLMLRQMLAMPFIAMTAVVGLVLLIACANLAGLLVARGTARQHEMAVRVAVGAGRWQLIRQSLTESLVLALLGGCVGFVVAGFGKQFLRGFLVMMPDEFTFDLSMDTRVLVFALGLSVLTALVFGLIPAVLAARIDPLKGLKSRSSMNRTRLRVGRVLVAAQVGLSVLLIVSAGLMVRSVSKLTRLDPGYDSENVLLFKLNPGQAEYKKQQLIRFYDQVQESLTKIPGVRSVACSSLVLASGSHSSTSFTLPGRQKQPDEQWHTATMSVSEDYFKTMSIPLNHGRSFNITDTPDTEPVVVVNETFAQQFYPDNATPLDQIVRIDDGTKRAFRIVGVSRDTTYDSLSSEIPPLVHLSQRQRVQGRTSIAVRSSLSPLSLVTTIRQAIGRIDSQIPMTHIITQTEQNERSIAAHRLFAGLGGFLAGLALLLSCIGLYCIIAYNMAQRTQEIGVRMALGATPAHVARPILREALLLTTIGLAIGLPLALGVAQIIKSQLYGVAPTDPVTIGAVCFTLISVALLAAWLPARRAAKIDPMEALRYE